MFILSTKLAGFGAAVTLLGAQQASLATLLTVDLRPGASKQRFTTMAILTPNTAGAAAALGTYDGTTLYGSVAIGVNGQATYSIAAAGTQLGGVIDNTGTQTDTYSYVVADMVI